MPIFLTPAMVLAIVLTYILLHVVVGQTCADFGKKIQYDPKQIERPFNWKWQEYV